MRVWRTCRKQRIHDLSGQGAKLNGGRWNRVGVPALYTSESHSLAILEALVHIESSNVPNDYFLVEIEFPDSFKIQELTVRELPQHWRDYPGPDELKQIGADWFKAGTAEVLSVPSAVNVYGQNYLINPTLPEYAKVKVLQFLPLQFDRRLTP